MNRYKLIAAMALLSMVSIFGYGNDNCCNACDTCCEPNCCQSCDPCNTCDSCCCSPCCCEPCDFVPPCPPDTCAYNAPAIIDIKCGCDFFVTASFVYFQAKEENLEWMELNYNTEADIDMGTKFSTVKEYSAMCFDYEPAFKVGLGFAYGCDNWSLYAEYFRYHADVGSGALSGEGQDSNRLEAILYSMPSDNNFVFDAASIKGTAKWRLEMDTADFLLSRRYYVGRCLVFQPYVGLRAAWIDQTYKVNYCYTDGLDPINQDIVDADVKLTSCSWGVGAKAGLHTDWNFCGGFYFFGDSSFDILYTDYEVKQKNEITVNDFSDDILFEVIDTTVDGKKTDKFCFLRPHLQVGLGLGWGDYFCCNDWYFDLKVGYEFHVYWNQNVLQMIPDLNQDPSRLYGDLDLHGLVITARLDF